MLSFVLCICFILLGVHSLCLQISSNSNTNRKRTKWEQPSVFHFRSSSRRLNGDENVTFPRTPSERSCALQIGSQLLISSQFGSERRRRLRGSTPSSLNCNAPRPATPAGSSFSNRSNLTPKPNCTHRRYSPAPGAPTGLLNDLALRLAALPEPKNGTGHPLLAASRDYSKLTLKTKETNRTDRRCSPAPGALLRS